MVLNEINTVKPFSFLSLSCVRVYLALENSRHFTTPQLVSRKMTSLTGLRNERRNSILMTRHYPDLGSASDWLNRISHAARPNQEHYRDLGINASSVWNFCARFSDVISRGNQW